MAQREFNKHVNANDLNIVFNFIYNVQIMHYKIQIFYIGIVKEHQINNRKKAPIADN